MRTLRSVSTKNQKWRQELHLALTVQRWKFHEKLLNRWQLQVQLICQLKSMKVFSANSVADSPTSYARVRSKFFTVKLLNASSAPKFFELFFFLFFWFHMNLRKTFARSRLDFPFKNRWKTKFSYSFINKISCDLKTEKVFTVETIKVNEDIYVLIFKNVFANFLTQTAEKNCGIIWTPWKSQPRVFQFTRMSDPLNFMCFSIAVINPSPQWFFLVTFK